MYCSVSGSHVTHPYRRARVCLMPAMCAVSVAVRDLFEAIPCDPVDLSEVVPRLPAMAEPAFADTRLAEPPGRALHAVAEPAPLSPPSQPTPRLAIPSCGIAPAPPIEPDLGLS